VKLGEAVAVRTFVPGAAKLSNRAYGPIHCAFKLVLLNNAKRNTSRKLALEVILIVFLNLVGINCVIMI
jgi:hypothetical protein